MAEDGGVVEPAAHVRPPTPAWAKVAFVLTGLLWTWVVGFSAWVALTSSESDPSDLDLGGFSGFMFVLLYVGIYAAFVTVLIWLTAGFVNVVVGRLRRFRDRPRA